MSVVAVMLLLCCCCMQFTDLARVKMGLGGRWDLGPRAIHSQ